MSRQEDLVPSEREDDDRLRTPQAVGQRVLVLSAVSASSARDDREAIVDWLKAEDLWAAVSAREAEFLSNPKPGNRDMAHASWQIECAWCLGWALQLVDELEPPHNECTPRLLLDHLPGPDEATHEFIDGVVLRPKTEISDASDMIYDAHCTARDASIHGKETPIRGEVVMEWHKAINWLTFYGDDDWDEVTTDT